MVPHNTNVARISYSQIFRYDSSAEDDNFIDYATCSAQLLSKDPQPRSTLSSRSMAMLINLNHKLDLLESQHIAMEKELAIQRTARDDHLKDHNQFQKENTDLRVERENLVTIIEKKQIEFAALKQAAQTWEQRVEAAENDAKQSRHTMDDLKQKLDTQEREMNISVARRQQSTAQSLALKTALDYIKRHKLHVCQVHQELRDTLYLATAHGTKQLQELTEKRNGIMALRDQRNELLTTLHDLATRIKSSSWRDDIELLAGAIDEHIKRQQSLDKMVDERQAQLATLLERIRQSTCLI